MERGRAHARQEERKRARFAALLLAHAACLLLAACSGGDAPSAIMPTAGPSIASPGPFDGTPFPTPPSEGAAFQEELLRDGLTEAEYERAVLTTLQCMVERGGEYENLEWIQKGAGRMLSYWIVDRGHTGASIRAHDDCYEEYTQQIDGAWQRGLAPSEEEFQERVEAYLECMRDAGYADVFFGPEFAETLDDAGHDTRVACEQSAGLLGESLTPP